MDLPENLQIKREHSPPSTPEDKSPNNIKAKLNLHVKRRLQDFNQAVEDNAINSNKPQVVVDIKQESVKLETGRQKRPYHKRTDKNKTSTICCETTSAIQTGAVATTTPQRKYKHKIKHIVSQEQSEASVHSSCKEETSTSLNANVTAGVGSAGDEDEGVHEGELKSGREKEKCPDVLAMVLSMKKRALMQDPEVQKFLQDVMEVIKG